MENEINSTKIEYETNQISLSTASITDENPPIKKFKTNIEVDQPNSSKNSINEENSQISKRQKKKLIKMKNWETIKLLKRQQEREKYKRKRLEAIKNGEPTRIGPSRKELKRKKLVENENNLKVAIDLNFDDLMLDRDISKCVKQLLRIYTVNRRSESPGKLYFTGIQKNGKIHQCVEKNDGYENWNVKWEFDRNYYDIFDKNQIIYLTSDSDNLLDKLDLNCVYIIGGIVDHNHHKGLCYDRAQKLNVKTARLPLNEHVDLKTRTVLSTFHVFEMLLCVSQGKSWTTAILDILPMRKGAKAKTENLLDDVDGNDDENKPKELKELENITS